jgi:hypothetical protein
MQFMSVIQAPKVGRDTALENLLKSHYLVFNEPIDYLYL